MWKWLYCSASLVQINGNESLLTFAYGERGLGAAVSGGDSVLASATTAAGAASATGAAVAAAATGAAVVAAGWVLASPEEGSKACPISCRCINQ